MNAPKLILGDCVEVMRGMQENSIDTIICDPPYGLEFMGCEWDAPWNARGEHRAGACFAKGGFAFNNGYSKRNTPTYGKAWQNKRCKKCGHIASGGSPCQCLDPEWSVERGVTAKPMQGFQIWCEGWAVEALRVLKPGGHLLAMGGSRTYHRLACAIEDAGFELRDCMMFLYGSGFPKSLDISKTLEKAAGVDREDKFEGSFDRRAGPTGNKKCDKCGKWLVSGSPCQCPRPQDKAKTEAGALWQGYCTALKPAWEPIVVAMKPCDGTFAENALKHGVAGLNIDGCRIETGDDVNGGAYRCNSGREAIGMFTPESGGGGLKRLPGQFKQPSGRFPANLVLDEEAARLLDEQSGEQKSVPHLHDHKKDTMVYGGGNGLGVRAGMSHFSDSGGASRFFYTAKSSRSEREVGLFGRIPCAKCKGLDSKTHKGDKGEDVPCIRNTHPTVKPLSLMRYLVRLTKTPTGGVVLDPFMGSGTTGVACVLEGREFIGIEKEQEYMQTAERRIAYAEAHPVEFAEDKKKRPAKKQEEPNGVPGQASLLDALAEKE